MLIQLHDLIPVDTPLGKGYAILFEANEHDNYWTVALNDSCAIVTFTQEKIRIAKSYTHHRGISDDVMKDIVAKSKPNGRLILNDGNEIHFNHVGVFGETIKLETHPTEGLRLWVNRECVYR